MSELDDTFAKLLGRQPSDAERQSLYRIKEALGIKNNGALWLVLMALEHYQKLYQDILGRIEETTRHVLYQIQDTADATMREAAEISKMEMAKALGETAAQVAQQMAEAHVKMTQEEVAARQRQGIMTGIAVATLAVLASVGIGYQLGRETARVEAATLAREETAATTWAKTPDGQLAYRWAQTGE